MIKPKFIILHHSAVNSSSNSDQFEANNNYHKSKGFPLSSLGYYLGYNYEIATNGRVRQARKEGEITAAVPELELNSGKAIHICLDGNFDYEEPKPSQIFALRDLLKKLTKEFGITEDTIYFHRTFNHKKTCPGMKISLCFIRGLIYK